MFTIKCEKCGGMVIIDELLTRDEYLKDMNYLVDENGQLLDSAIQQYLMYKCVDCNELYKLTYKEWEKLFRKKLAEEIMYARKAKMFRDELNPDIIDPDNGFEFCGQCDGNDGEGNCFTDIIKQCTITKK